MLLSLKGGCPVLPATTIWRPDVVLRRLEDSAQLIWQLGLIPHLSGPWVSFLHVPRPRRNISNSHLSPCQPMKSRLAMCWDSAASSMDSPSLALSWSPSSRSFVSLLTSSAQHQPNPSSATAILSSFKRQSPWLRELSRRNWATSLKSV